jgi:N-terminal glutamine amidase
MPSQFLPTAAESALSPNVSTDQNLRCAFFCEENVWRLAYRKLHLHHCHQPDGDKVFFVAVISNTRKCVPMLYQRASISPADKACQWDYHVILIGVSCRSDETAVAQVYDVDTTLAPYPIPLSAYLDASFPTSIPVSYAPLFRLITAESYLRCFGSDRCHMYDTTTRTWSAPPPPYQCILASADDPTNSASAGDSAANYDEQQATEKRTAESDTPVPVPSSRSNLHLYLHFGESKLSSSGPVDPLGSILTLQQLKGYNFLSIRESTALKQGYRAS